MAPRMIWTHRHETRTRLGWVGLGYGSGRFVPSRVVRFLSRGLLLDFAGTGRCMGPPSFPGCWAFSQSGIRLGFFLCHPWSCFRIVALSFPCSIEPRDCDIDSTSYLVKMQSAVCRDQNQSGTWAPYISPDSSASGLEKLFDARDDSIRGN